MNRESRILKGEFHKRLGLLLAAVLMLACGDGPELSQDSQALRRGAGAHEDEWVGPQATLSLSNPQHQPGMTIAGENVLTGMDDESLTIRVIFPSGERDSVTIETPGDFQAFLQIPPVDVSRDVIDLHLTSSKAFVPSQLCTSPDDRVLAFRLVLIATIDEESLAEHLPSSYEFPNPGESSNVVGVFADGWISDRATVTLHPRGGLTTIEIRGYIPTGLPDRWILKANDRVLLSGRPPRQESGVFNARVELPEDLWKARRLDLQIIPGGTYVPAERGLNEDQRSLSYKLVYVRMAH
jgi:hypothetical protein